MIDAQELIEIKEAIEDSASAMRIPHCQPNIQAAVLRVADGRPSLSHDVIIGWQHYGTHDCGEALLATWHGTYRPDPDLSNIAAGRDVSFVMYDANKDEYLCGDGWVNQPSLFMLVISAMEKNKVGDTK